MRKYLYATVAAAALAAAPAAYADIIFSATGGGTGDNILFGAKEQATTITGFTNMGNTPVTFSTLSGQTLVQPGSGQADIMCAAACINGGSTNTNMQLNSLEIKIGGGFAATELISDLNFGEGAFTINVTDQMGATFTFTLGNGSNFFDLTAINGEVITDVQITDNGTISPAGWNDYKQPRITVCTLQSNNTCTPVTGVPEPASLGILGTGLMLLSMLGWKRYRG